MIRLMPVVTECVALTRQRGTLVALDGNILYFAYEVWNHGEEEIQYGAVDLSVSRKTFYPDQRLRELNRLFDKPNEVDVDEIAFGLWILRTAGLEPRMGNRPYPTSYDGRTQENWVFRNDINLKNFKDAAHNHFGCQTVPEGEVQGPRYWWQIDESLFEEARFLAKERNSEIRAAFHASRPDIHFSTISESAEIASIFSFDGDKKSLVTALKTVWNVQFSDRDVKMDKLKFKCNIILPQTLEEIVLQSRDKY